jgi:hypothetical protein
MQHYRCKCGKSECYGSWGPNQCDGCKYCNTTLTQHPDHHKEPEPHKYIETLVEADNGKHVLSRCQWCMRTKKEIEKSK